VRNAGQKKFVQNVQIKKLKRRLNAEYAETCSEKESVCLWGVLQISPSYAFTKKMENRDVILKSGKITSNKA